MSAMQNRVRRLIGRRRGGGGGAGGGGGGGGLDRFIGSALRDPAGSQDSVLVDPISELLAQLSSAGSGAPPPSGGGTRRILSDVPSHIQQLLEQQERQVLERGSPSRRPYRKIVISGGPSGSEGAAGNGAPVFAWSKPEDFPAVAVLTSRESRVPNANKGRFLLEEHSKAPPLTEEELKQLPQVRARKSLFVQELLLSMLTSSSSDDSSDDQEGT
eukprot:Em0013g255a